MNSRREFLSKAFSAGAALGLGPLAIGKELPSGTKALPSLKGRRVLFTYGGWDGHEPQKYVDFLTPWMKNEGAEVLLFNTLDSYMDKTLMDSIDLVVQIFTMSQISKEQEARLIAAVEKN